MREKETTHGRRADAREDGFALILALLVLMLMTFLGLTLATQTSTEMQIATNYRWSQQAQYNAEAGIEVGKGLLRNMNWSLILPPARPAPWQFTFAGNVYSYAGTPPPTPTAPFDRPDKQGNVSRNFENKDCDLVGGQQGFGVVLDDGGATAPYQNITTLMGRDLAGAVTLWVRHPTQKNQDGSYQDCTSTPCGGTGPPGSPDDILILTAEGVAPYVNPRNASRSFIQTRSVATREMTLTRTLGTPCGTRGGQIGGGPEGSNFSPCDPITGESWRGAVGRTLIESTNVQ